MKKNKILYILSSALVLFSCAKEASVDEAPSVSGEMRFAVTVEGSKASMTSADLQQFYLKVTGPNNAFSYFESITKDNTGVWKASCPILWKDEQSSINYSAASYGALGPDYFNVPVTDALYTAGANMGILTDQSTQARLNAADLLSMTPVDLSFANSNKGVVPITLKHALAKLNFSFNLADEFFDNGIGLSESPIQDVVITGVYTSFNFKPLTGAVTIPATVQKGAVVPFQSAYTPGSSAAKKAVAKFESVLAPQNLGVGDLGLVFTIGGKDYDWSNTKALNLEQGGEYTVTVDVAY